jgi:hypothetical protein
MRLRCRTGFHKWVRIRETDPTVANPSQTAEWRTVCRDCNSERGSGVVFSTIFFLIVFTASLVVLWFYPLLGAILVIGSVAALGPSVAPAAIERIARWLSR